MKNKKAVAGEGILMIYRLIIISFIALIILGLAAVFYDYYLNVRDAEAIILTKHIVNCVAPEGVVDLERFEGYENKLLDFCGIKNNDRFYANVKIFMNNKVKELEQGDAGIGWAENINEKSKTKFKKYEIGNYNSYYPAVIKNNSELVNGNFSVNVLVGPEF